ncbi:uncharacterized protein LOC6541827 [Drosophila erecta]|uniref:Uncharacterized protein n=1 Tax=Drosophila erecta TaxID=7220 RepID=B3NAH7_DROER|nr:uncharacterized protein LOC6541827 [Drosophila erecta]EDV59731.1 uncharacterized protein Dere_GG10773 [Drosophila erecta]
MSTSKTGQCRAPGILQLEEQEESDLLTSGRDPSDAEEETDLDAAYDELEEMKQRLIALRNKVVITNPDVCQELKVREGGALQQLRDQKCQLICRLQEVTQHLEDSQKELKELETWCCQLQYRIQQANRQLDQFEDFKLRVIHQFGLCIERWEHQKTHKIDCATYRKEMEAHVHHADNSRKSVVPLKCHKSFRRRIRIELLLLRVFLHNLFETMVSDFKFFGRHMSINFSIEPVHITSTKVPETPIDQESHE